MCKNGSKDSNRNLIVACAQIQCKMNEECTEEGIALQAVKMQEFLGKASENGVDVVCFAECSLNGYFPEEESFKRVPDSFLDDKVREIQGTCGDLNISCLLGVTAHGESKPLNRMLVISNTGEIVATYDKTHLFPSEEEYYAAGSEFVSFDIKGVCCSVIVCHDLDRYPEICRILRNRGVRLLFHPAFTSAGGDYQREWFSEVLECLYRARAAENGLFIATVNGAAGGGKQCAHSMIIDPEGRVLAKAPRGREELVVATVDIDQADREKSGWKDQGRYNRRTDMYNITDLGTDQSF